MAGPIFGSWLNDAIVAFLLGAFGGLAAVLVERQGALENRHWVTKLVDKKEVKTHFYDIGTPAEMVVGGVAALSLFYVLSFADPGQFIGASIVAGVGGSAILTAITNRLIGEIAKKDATTAINTIRGEAIDAIDEAEDALNKIAKTLPEEKDLRVFATKLAVAPEKLFYREKVEEIINSIKKKKDAISLTATEMMTKIETG